ncbi:hypothetical protein KDAU_01010 [Dictyobacter aurantiacus]|uniref:Carrier domain-containing protein n=1 Tax=Dictyobacter aurantiacus TaxID=1936993 RepID=A0A401Z7E3_9CHLR|nr:hypothetical protein KDAU_01010 [Dictyobacter aurantiacus]
MIPLGTSDTLSPYLNTANNAYNARISSIITGVVTRFHTKIALISAQETLTYDELNRRANQLAHYLQSQGVGPNTLVGCYLERSTDFIVSVLAILKAGAAYIPMDPSYPVGRLNYMIQDAQMPLVVTKQELAEQPGLELPQAILLDTQAALLAAQDQSDPETTVTGEDLAYVIYTSGSTGLPKGVQITHNNLANLVAWHHEAFAVTADDRATQISSPAFDAAVWEIWPYLTKGASLYIPDEETRVTPVALRDWLLQNKITITFLPTVLAESLLQLEWPGSAPLRYLLTGADTLHRYPTPALPFALVNNYGPSETTVVATSGVIPPTEHPETPPSIGRAITHVDIHILDKDLQPVPVGTTGEIYIGGASVGSGYLHRPELTAERFIQDPFSNSTQARLYKTGDLGYALPDGQIMFIGREDHQIKIRGYRIEPGEIVHWLNELEDIQASVVVASKDEDAEQKSLIAYLVMQPETELTASEIRDALSNHLPSYMLPATFVQIEQLPLTANGKLDRAALPEPDDENMLPDEESDEPATVIEEQVSEIIGELLHIEYVGRDDNFFMLGGHSLLGTQMIARIQALFEVTLTLRTLFESPTARLLADEIEQRLIDKITAMSEDEAQSLLRQGQNQ